MAQSRKDFLKNISIATLGFTSFSKIIASGSFINKVIQNKSLIKDPKGIIDLPAGFKYSIISKFEDKMDDGLTVPDAADGMACFKGKGDNVILVRNHELGHLPLLENSLWEKYPFGENQLEFMKKNRRKFYDIKDNKTECFGGTTTIVYNTKSDKVEKQYLSLAGTLVNCSGGPTPWNTWISCEETVKRAKGKITKDHGYNFEVNVNEKVKLSSPVPLKSMGRFRHEAIAVDPKRGFVYQTEDREDGLFYRFIPKVKQNLKKGGKLQALSIVGYRGYDCTNWKNNNFKVGDTHKVKWVEMNNVDSPKDDLRRRGKNKGCAFFARGEGLWYADDYVYFTSTTGGKEKRGQVWRYKHQLDGKGEGILELFFESTNKDILNMPDNITVSPWGDLILSEDGKGHDRLVGVSMNGGVYNIAKNVLNKSEFAGACFSQDGKFLFVNIYKPTMTIAVSGPWHML